MSTTTVTSITKQNPFKAAQAKLISDLLSQVVPSAYPSFPSPGDHAGIAAYIREAAQIFDGWLAAVGAEVRDNAVTSISKDLFAGSFEAAIDGNETYACESQGEALRDYASERRTSMRRAM
jgi:hypothetical protein